ncbi:hypothetical protein MMC28_009965 [Mycoblastus sanguinarius]|nr:hypothetical protein [Mycoblastus sanguinarius]
MENTTPYFQSFRLNTSTFVIVENDKYEEHPFIYIKIYEEPPLLLVTDTGCGGGAENEDHSSSLKDFIETSPISSNGEKPLNPHGSSGQASKKYLIICTHCHYDHILGLRHFQKSSPRILASSHDKSFIEDDLAEHSLCRSLGVPLPEYKVSYWADDHERLSFDGHPLNLQVLHTPGHTPDELAYYDEEERHLYVGDTLYERVAVDKSYEQAILFPKEGNLTEYMQSLEKLIGFVKEKNSEPCKSPVTIGCGHVTSAVDGMEILLAVRQLFFDIIAEKVPIVHSEEKRGEEFVLWREDGEPRFSVAAPLRLAIDARKDQQWT